MRLVSCEPEHVFPNQTAGRPALGHKDTTAVPTGSPRWAWGLCVEVLGGSGAAL